MIRTVIIASMFIIASAAASAHVSPFTPGMENGFGASSENPFRQLANPALGGFRNAPSVHYRATIFDTGRVQDQAAGLSGWGFSFIYGYYHTLYDRRIDRILHGPAHYFHASRAFSYRDIVSAGTSFSFSESRDRKFKGYMAWSAGLVLRPMQWISFGFAMQELGARVNGNRLDWKEIYSISVRPGTDRVSLSGEAVRGRNVPVTRMLYRFGVDARLPGDFLLHARGDSRLDFRLGASLPVSFPWKRPATLRLDYDRLVPGKGHGSQLLGASLSLDASRSPMRVVRGQRYLFLKVNKGYAEIRKRDILGRKRTIWADIVLSVKTAGDDPDVAGVIMHIRSAPLGLVQIEELRDELARLRGKGKKVYAVLSSPGNREYYLATAADKIYLSPQSLFYITGLRAQVYFYKGLMDKVGVKFEAVKSGAYKSYPESYTREHLSDEARANLTALITGMNENYLQGIVDARKISRADIEALFEKGAVTPAEAVTMRFADRVLYPDEALKDIGKGLVYLEPLKYLRERRGERRTWGPADRIAVVCVSGSIVSGASFKTEGSHSIGDEAYRGALDRAFGDPRVKAVVIRIDSGGGSAQASDNMWRYLVVKKKARPKIPVIFSFANMAASGGYYIACGGDRVFAGRNTITGSIGVFSGKLSLEGLYRLLGINRDVVKMSEFADTFTEARDYTPRERELVQKGISYLYDQFTTKVLQGRKLAPEKLPRIAEGRVMTGTEARGLSLVDEIGGLTAAVEMARARGRLGRDYELVFYPDAKEGIRDLFRIPLLDFLTDYLGAHSRLAALRDLSKENAFYLMPWVIDIQ